MSKFEELLKLNVNDKTEKKEGLTYLTWSWAWSEFKKAYPDAIYEVIKYDGQPYFESNLGYMVYTQVTAGGITHEMWLPVMNGANKAMKSESYTYKTKYGDKYVESATMFDVNKTIMRCLVKNLAMFGLGLYIFSGEDLPEGEEEKPVGRAAAALKPKKTTEEYIKDITSAQNEDELKAAYSKIYGEIKGDATLLAAVDKVKDDMKSLFAKAE